MRKLIHIPMIHTNEAVTSQSEIYGKALYGQISPFSEHVSPVVKRYWNVIESSLKDQTPNKARFYVESYSEDPEVIQPGAVSTPLDHDDLTPDGSGYTQFYEKSWGNS